MSAQKFRFVLIGLIVASLLASGAVGYYGVTIFKTRTAEIDKVKIEAEINNEASIDATQAEMQFQDPRIAQLTEYLEVIVPEAAYRDQFVADINKYADNQGLSILSLVYVASEEGATETTAAPAIPGSRAIPVQLTLNSNIPYDKFINFVEALESNLQHIQVLSLDLSPSTEDRTRLANAGITIALYVEQ